MESIHDQATGSGVCGNEANWSEANSGVFMKTVDQAALTTVSPEFFVDLSKDLSRQYFNLSVHLVRNSGRRPKCIALLSQERVPPNVPSTGKRLTTCGRDLRQERIAGLPCQDMSRGSDPHSQYVVILPDFAISERLEEFRMQRPAVQMHRHQIHRRTDRCNVHDLSACLCPVRDYSSERLGHNPDSGSS